ncbi:MAG: response regulator [Candidatus Anammoxibacter sp.]
MIKKILIIDDSRVSRLIMKKCIPNDKGYEFAEAGDGQEGLEKYRESKPDVVILDLTMPVMDGREFLVKVKDEPHNALVIVCTADIQKKSIDDVMLLGALEVIKKPPSKDTVQGALARVDEKLKELNR